MNIKLEKISYYLPEKIIRNEDLEKLHPDWQMSDVVKKSGVYERRVAKDGETAFDMGIKSINRLLCEYKVNINEIEGILFCTQSPDYIIPGNSHLVHAHYPFKKEVVAFDISLACSGYIYALSIAYSMMKSGLLNNFLIVTSDTYSKYINPMDRSAKVLFGDGATATYLERGDVGDSKVIDISLGTYGLGYENFYIKNGGSRYPKFNQILQINNETINREDFIKMNGVGVWSSINSLIPNSIHKILVKNNLDIESINYFIFHQASIMTIESIIKALNIDKKKVMINMEKIGNTVSSSIPICLKDSMAENKINKGSKVLVCGFGAGISFGTVLLEL